MTEPINTSLIVALNVYWAVTIGFEANREKCLGKV